MTFSDCELREERRVEEKEGGTEGWRAGGLDGVTEAGRESPSVGGVGSLGLKGPGLLLGAD